MKLKIVVPDKILFDGEAKSVKFLASRGDIEILSHHTPLFTDIKMGEMEYVNDKNEKHNLAVSSGFAQVVNNITNIVLDTAIYVHDINIEKVQQARDAAEKLLTEQGEKANIEHIRSQLQLADLHLNLHKKYHTKKK